jgi:hypothetical protein
MRTSSAFRILVAALSPLVAAAGRASGQGITGEVDNIGYGTRAAEFLLLPVGARATALGQAYSSLADDAVALYWNPSGIGLSGQPSIHLSYLDYLVGTSYTWAGVAVPLGTGEWVVGAQVGAFSFGEQPVYTVEQPDGTGSTYSNSMTVIGLSVAYNVNVNFSVGATAKLVSERFAQTEGQTGAADVGVNYHTAVAGRPFRASLALLNLGGEIQPTGSDLSASVPEQNPNVPERLDQAQLATQPFPLPVLFKIGLGYDVLARPTGRLLVAGEVWQPQQNNTTAAFGAEYTFTPTGATGFSLALRGGWTYEPDRSFSTDAGNFDDEGTDGLTFGGGVGYRTSETGFAIQVDYAYRNLGLLGSANQFSFTVRW